MGSHRVRPAVALLLVALLTVGAAVGVRALTRIGSARSTATSVPSGARVSPSPRGHAGQLDPTFGRAGSVVDPTESYPGTVLMEPDGRIVVAGIPPLARYNSNGAADTTFGRAGKAEKIPDGPRFDVLGVAIDPNGKIVVTGVANGDNEAFQLARFNKDGTLDSGFGRGGWVRTAFHGGGYSTSLAIQRDGRIVAAGIWRLGPLSSEYSGPPPNPTFALARYRSNGTLDPTFGRDGRVTTDLTPGDDFSRAVALQPDGKILVCGEIQEGMGSALVRYRTDGALDRTFAGDGKIITRSLGRSAAAMVVQADGRILVMESSSREGVRPNLARYDPNGRLDSTFGRNGRALLPPMDAWSMDLQSDGRIVVVGTNIPPEVGPPAGYVVTRYMSDGTLDPTFGKDGKVIESRGEANGVVIQSDGKILVAGSVVDADGIPRLFLARFLPR